MRIAVLGHAALGDALDQGGVADEVLTFEPGTDPRVSVAAAVKGRQPSDVAFVLVDRGDAASTQLPARFAAGGVQAVIVDGLPDAAGGHSPADTVQVLTAPVTVGQVVDAVADLSAGFVVPLPGDVADLEITAGGLEEPAPAPAAADDEDDLPDWASGLGDDSDAEGDGLPDWAQGVDTGPIPVVEQPGPPEGLPDWAAAAPPPPPAPPPAPAPAPAPQPAPEPAPAPAPQPAPALPDLPGGVDLPDWATAAPAAPAAPQEPPTAAPASPPQAAAGAALRPAWTASQPSEPSTRLALPAAPAAATRTPLFVVGSYKGGVGKTTVAILLAGLLADTTGKRVALIDGNVAQSSVGTVVGLEGPSRTTLADLASDPARLADPDQVAAAFVNVPGTTLDVLLGASDLRQANPDLITADVLRKVAAVARDRYDVVVVDTPVAEAVGSSAAAQLMADLVAPEATRLIVVVAPETETVRRNLSWLELAGDPVMAPGGLALEPQRCGIVLNRAPANGTWTAPDVEAAFRAFPWLGAIPVDDAVLAASNDQQLAVPSGPARDALLGVLSALTGDPALTPAAARPGRRLFRRRKAS